MNLEAKLKNNMIFKKIGILFLLFPILVIANEPNPIALEMIKKFGFADNLAQVSYQIAENSEPYKTIVRRVGESRAELLVKAEINALLPQYHKQWEEKLATSYAEAFSGVELNSLNNEGPISRYYPQIRIRQKQINYSMQSKSQDLLQDLLSKAMQAALTKALVIKN